MHLFLLLGDRMKGSLEDVKIDLPCNCGKVTQKSVGWVRSHSHETFQCDCGRVLHLDASDIKRKLAEAGRVWAKSGKK
jgi:hypothetical protein